MLLYMTESSSNIMKANLSFSVLAASDQSESKAKHVVRRD